MAAVAAVVVLAAAAVGVIALDRRWDGHAKPVVPSAAPITSTVPPAPVAPLPTKVLDGLMLSTDEVAQIMGASQLAVYKTFDTLIDESAVIAQKNCLGSYAPAQIAAYANTGWTAARAQAVHEPGDVPIKNGALLGSGSSSPRSLRRVPSALPARCCSSTLSR